MLAHVPRESRHAQQGSTWHPSASCAATSCPKGQYQDLAPEDKIQILQEIINTHVHHVEIRHLLPSRLHRRATPWFFPMMKVNKHREGSLLESRSCVKIERSRRLTGSCQWLFPISDLPSARNIN